MSALSGPEPRLSVVEDATGEIRIGSIPAAPAGMATASIPGGTLYVDPTRPEAPPVAVVADRGESGAAIGQIFGEDMAAAVARGECPATVPVVATDAAARLTRLGILRWLGSTSPFPLDRGLLLVETAVAAAACGDALANDDQTPPTLEELGDAVVALAWTVREGGSAAMPAGLSDLLEDALNGLVLGLGPDDPLGDVARHEAELRHAMSALSIDRLDWSRWDELAGQARPRAATSAGPDDAGRLDLPGGRSHARGTSSVDWTRVPIDLLDPSEGTVDWLVYPVEGEKVGIKVSVRARGEPAGEFRLADWLDRADEAAATALRRLSGRGGVEPALRFRVYLPGFGLPLATGALSRSTDGTRWEGRTEVPGRALRAGPIFVDVHSAGAPGPQRDRDVAAEAGRWAVRGLGLLRLSLVGTAAAHDVRGPLERARQLYATAARAAGHGVPDESFGLRRSLARCEALLAAHMVRADERRAAERFEARLARAELLPGDADIPDLGSPSWLPTVTERALLQRTSIDD